MSKELMERRLVDLVKDALREYQDEVNRSSLSPASKANYLSHASDFVKWLEDEFTPGRGRVRRGS